MTSENVYASDIAIIDCYDTVQIPEDLNLQQRGLE